MWGIVGGIGAVATLAVFTPLILIVPALVALGGFMFFKSRARVGVLGVVSGLGLPLLFVAWVNRAGPGMSCWTSVTGGGCDQRLDPWPWLLIGLLLVGLGIGLFARRPSH